jgi:putative hydrolase of the HAD superfamily
VKPFTLIGFDADDTLWHSEDSFEADKARFIELVAPHADEGIDLIAALTSTERRNMPSFGYGVRAFGLSMIETAVAVTGGRLPSSAVAELVEMTRNHVDAPVRLLPGVADVVAAVGSDYRIVLITKGDLLHQTQKIVSSGMGALFERCEIVLEKDVDTYARLLGQFGVEPHEFCMVGNSVRSDVLPVMDLGGHGVHVPYHLLWELEEHDDDHPHAYTELASLSELPAWLADLHR